jgi:hypothetical protein
MKYLVIMMGLATGCNYPDPGIRVSREGGRYIVSIRDCSKKALKIPVWGLAIKRVVPNDAEGDVQCELQILENPENDTLVRWEYGTKPSGYGMGSCLPFQPGASYHVRVNSRPKPSWGSFTIAAGCRSRSDA